MPSGFRLNRFDSNMLRRHISALSVAAAITLVAPGPAGVHALEGAWTNLNPETPPRVTSAHLFGVDFSSDSTGVIVGEGGVVYYTTDRGDTWTAAASGTTEDLNAVQLIDATTAATTAGSYGPQEVSTTPATTCRPRWPGSNRHPR